RARHRLGRQARRPRGSGPGAAQAPLSAGTRRQAAGRGANRAAMSFLERFYGPPPVRVGPVGTEAAARLAAIHATAFARPWSTLDFERLLSERSVLADGLFLRRARLPAGFALSRVIPGEAEILTVAMGPEA